MIAEGEARLEALLDWGRSYPLDENQAASLAEIALDQGRADDAVVIVAQSAERHRDNAALWQWMALLHRAIDQHGIALDAYARAIELRPEDPRLAHGQAITLLEAGLPAAAAFERACRLDPRDSEIYLGWMNALVHDGRGNEAIERLDAVLTRSPGWQAGHDCFARLCWVEGQAERMVATLDRAITAMPQAHFLWRTLLVLLIHADRFEDALAVAALARAAIGDHPAVLANEACALSELGRVAPADALFAKINATEDLSVLARLLRHALRNGRPEQVVDLAGAEVERPGGEMLWPYLSLAWRLRGDPRWTWLEGDPALVGVYDLREKLPPLDQLETAIRALHRTQGRPLDQSIRGSGTQSDGALFQHVAPETVALRAAAADAVRRHIDQLPPVDPAHPLLRMRRDRPVRFAASWSIRLAGGGHHAHHFHPAGWLSSALHLALPPRAATDGDHAGWLALGIPQQELGLDLAPTRLIEPRPGHVVLFPSFMWHGTLPFAAGERLSVAFDVASPGL
jgi:tetratricopeptide (TPR) repeat protein